MADRVHPSYSDHESSISPLSSSEHPLRPNTPSREKPVPPPGTYVIQVPKDQVYRVPPPQNAHLFQHYSRRKPSRSSLRCCICSFLAFIAALCVLAVVTGAVLYLVYRPESPGYSIQTVAIRGINASSSSVEISPAIDVTVRAQNPNDKLGIYDGKGSSVKVFYSDVELCNGPLPAFYQPTNNFTAFKTALKGQRIELTAAMKKSLRDGEKKGRVPLKLRMNIPVKVKVGSVNTWTLAVKVRCDLAVDKLTADAKIVTNDCNRSWRLWW